jgi:hypothetical protein
MTTLVEPRNVAELPTVKVDTWVRLDQAEMAVENACTPRCPESQPKRWQTKKEKEKKRKLVVE